MQRIESGIPRYGVDVDDTRLAMEARLEWAIHFAKGCYVGQEVIVRIVHRGGGRVVRKLVGLVVDGDCVPAARAAMSQLVAEDGDRVSYQQAQVLAQWGDRDAALERLEHALGVGDSGLIYARNDPLLDPLRDDARFARLLHRLGFD